MADEKTYRLTTIKDIFDHIPLDRMGAFMDELTVAMLQAGVLREDLGDGAFRLPEEVTWVDDGQGDVSVNIVDRTTGDTILKLHDKISRTSDRRLRPCPQA